MRIDDDSIDFRHPIVDPIVAIIDVDETETDRRVSIDLLDFVQDGIVLGYGARSRLLVAPWSNLSHTDRASARLM